MPEPRINRGGAKGGRTQELNRPRDADTVAAACQWVGTTDRGQTTSPRQSMTTKEICDGGFSQSRDAHRQADPRARLRYTPSGTAHLQPRARDQQVRERPGDRRTQGIHGLPRAWSSGTRALASWPRPRRSTSRREGSFTSRAACRRAPGTTPQSGQKRYERGVNANDVQFLDSSSCQSGWCARRRRRRSSSAGQHPGGRSDVDPDDIPFSAGEPCLISTAAASKVCSFCLEPVKLMDLQGGHPAAPVPVGNEKRKGAPAAPDDRDLRAPSAFADRGAEAGAAHRAAAVRGDPLTTEARRWRLEQDDVVQRRSARTGCGETDGCRRRGCEQRQVSVGASAPG